MLFRSLDVDQLVGGSPEAPERLALLAVRPERASALRARGSAVPEEPSNPTLARAVADRELIEVPYTSAQALADEIAGYAEAVLVLDPPELREHVLERLRAAAALTLTPPGADDV